MPTKNFTGTTNSTWSTGSNWDAGTAPGTDDEVYISSGPKINGEDVGSTDLDVLNVGPEYSERIGSSGNPLIVAADSVIIRGGGNIFLTAGTAGIDSLVVDTGKNENTQTIELSGTITTLVVNSSHVKIVGGTVTDLFVEGSGHVEIDGGTVTNCYANNGQVEVVNSSSTVSTLWNRACTSKVEAGGITAAYLVGDGTLTYDSTSTITTLRALAGQLLRNDNRPLTITNAYIHSQASADLRHKGVTLTNSYQIGPASQATYMPAGTATMEF